MLDGQWDAAIRRVTVEDPEASIFVERREDLTVSASTGQQPEVRHTVWSGVTHESPGAPMRFRSGLPPDGLEAWVHDRRPAGQSIREPAPPELDATLGVDSVSELVVETQRAVPDAQIEVLWVEFDQQVRIGRDGPVVGDRRKGRRLRIDAGLSRGGRMARATVERIVQDDKNSTQTLSKEIVERLETRLEAVDPPVGDTAVIFAPGIAGIWIHELVGHAAEADVAIESGAWPSGDRFPGNLTVIDDPRRGRAAWKIDDEGTPSRPVALIHHGRPRDLLHSLRTAEESGQRPTGHGRRSSFREPVLPRMGCTFIANGADEPRSILQNTKQAVYVRRMESAHTDPISGRAVFRVSDADLVLQGKIDAPLQPCLLETLAGQALAAIDFIGNDLQFDRCIGSCHRQGQPLSISVGAPTICTRLMTVRF